MNMWKLNKLFLFLIFQIFLIGLICPIRVHAVTCTAASDGDWRSVTWTGCDAPGYPVSGDAAVIGATRAITIQNGQTDAADSLTFTNTGSTLTITGTLNISGAVTQNNAANATWSNTIAGTGTLSAASVVVGGTTALSGSNTTRTTTLITTITAFNVSGNVTVTGVDPGTPDNDGRLYINEGTMDVDGVITLTPAGQAVAILRMDQGAQTGTLNISNASPISGSGTFTVNGTSATVNYNGTNQTGYVTTYTNLTLSTSDTKTFATTPTVNGTLSMQGTAIITVTTGVVTYGAAGALQYNTSTSRTASSEEWLTTFAGTGGVTIANTGTITLNEAKNFSASSPLTINSGAALNTDGTNNYALDFAGNFANNGGTFTANASNITISGTQATQTISGFTTTGSVSMTKTSNTATFQSAVSAGALTINGSGGTLNLGTSLTHTFSGTWTRTNGTLDGGSSTVNFSAAGVMFSGSGGAFTASTSTVNYSNASDQTFPALTYNNLTLSGGGTKTVATTPTVNAILSMEGTAIITVTTGVVTYGASSTLQYNTATSRTASSEEWITTFSGSGGIIITNTGTITLNEAKVVSAPITINSSAGLNTDAGNNYSLTATTVAINNTSTLTINNSVLTLNGTSGTILTRTGTFSVGGGSKTVFSGNASVTLLSAATTFDFLLLAPTVASTNKTYTAGAAFIVNDNLEINATASSSLSLTVNLSGAATITGLTTITGTTSGTSTLDETASNYTFTSGTVNLDSGNTLNIRDGVFNLTGTTGTLFTRGGTFTVGGGSKTVYSGDGSTTLVSAATTFDFLQLSPTVTGSDKTYAAGAALTINDNLEINATASSALRLTLTLSANSSTTGTTTVTGTTSGLSTFDTSGSNYTYSTAALIIGAAGTFTANSSNAVTINGASGTIFSNAGTFTAGGSTVTISGSGTLTFTSATTFNNLNITGTETVSTSFTVGGALNVSGSGNLSPSAGTVTMNNGSSIANSATLVFYNLTIASGATVTTSSSFSIAATLTNSSTATFTASSGTITMSTAASTITNSGSSLTFSGLTIAATPTAQSQYNTSFSVGGALTVNSGITFAPSGGTITFTTGGSIVNNGGAATNLIFQGLTITSGTVTSGSSFQVLGNWTNGGTFTQSAGTITYNGSGAQSISGTNNYTNLTISAAATRTVTITSGAILAVAANGTLTLTGADASNKLTLNASSTTDWYLRVSTTSPTFSISHIVVDRSDASGYQQINASNGTNSGTNTTNWNFGGGGGSADFNFGEGLQMEGININ